MGSAGEAPFEISELEAAAEHVPAVPLPGTSCRNHL